MKKKMLILAFGLFCCFYRPLPVDAVAAPDAELEVAPLSCLFEQVNDGSNNLSYLSPAECGPAAGEVPTLAAGEPEAPLPDAVTASALVQPNESLTEAKVKPETDTRNTQNPLVQVARAGQAFVHNPAYASVTTIAVASGVIIAAVPMLRVRVVRRLLFLKNLITPKG